MSDDALRYWLALSFVKDVGPVTIKKLVALFHAPERIFSATIAELLDVEDVGEVRARSIREFASWKAVDREIKAVQDKGIGIITYTDDAYPVRLREIDDSPVVPYIKGGMTDEDNCAVAMVGSRAMTDYGRIVSERIASGLAASGITVVSGMARGIDTVSHRAALRAGGRSIAVLGCGLDRPYPSENRRLMEEIAASGCVISEFPLGTPPNREN
ncbi:MAG: DNA-processing protein DprA, partial [Thermodesulfovibrionales bacterium]